MQGARQPCRGVKSKESALMDGSERTRPGDQSIYVEVTTNGATYRVGFSG